MLINIITQIDTWNALQMNHTSECDAEKIYSDYTPSPWKKKDTW